jgi:hypothetical protein
MAAAAPAAAPVEDVVPLAPASPVAPVASGQEHVPVGWPALAEPTQGNPPVVAVDPLDPLAFVHPVLGNAPGNPEGAIAVLEDAEWDELDHLLQPAGNTIGVNGAFRDGVNQRAVFLPKVPEMAPEMALEMSTADFDVLYRWTYLGRGLEF